MKMLSVLLLPAVLVLAILSSAAYQVSEVEQVIITKFGQPIGDPIKDPGLHFRIPFIHKVNRFDKRWLDWDGDANKMATKEKTYIWVDVYARWRINNPLQFLKGVKYERRAQYLLDDIIGAATRNVIAAHDLIEVVREPNRKFEVDNVIIEPGATSTKFLVYGKRGESGVMYHLDFSVMGVPACQQAWQPGSATSDYMLWNPTDTKNSDGCLMGKIVTYLRFFWDFS